MSVACWKPMHGTLVLCAAFSNAILLVLLRSGEFWETSGILSQQFRRPDPIFTSSHYFATCCCSIAGWFSFYFLYLVILVSYSLNYVVLLGSGNSQASHGVVFMESRHSALLGTSIPAGKEFCFLYCQHKRYRCSASEEQALCSGGRSDKEMFIGKHRNILSWLHWVSWTFTRVRKLLLLLGSFGDTTAIPATSYPRVVMLSFSPFPEILILRKYVTSACFPSSAV